MTASEARLSKPRHSHSAPKSDINRGVMRATLCIGVIGDPLTSRRLHGVAGRCQVSLDELLSCIDDGRPWAGVALRLPLLAPEDSLATLRRNRGQLCGRGDEGFVVGVGDLAEVVGADDVVERTAT